MQSAGVAWETLWETPWGAQPAFYIQVRRPKVADSTIGPYPTRDDAERAARFAQLEDFEIVGTTI